MRASLAEASGLGGPGRCTATALALAVGELKDPAVRSLVEVVTAWLKAWPGLPDKAKAFRAWHSKLAKLRALEPRRRWADVGGTMSATIFACWGSPGTLGSRWSGRTPGGITGS